MTLWGFVYAVIVAAFLLIVVWLGIAVWFIQAVLRVPKRTPRDPFEVMFKDKENK